ncbi:hypothetical protein BDP55DRAFT_653929 [Colletotrichum godetiae]|uniref:CorA-like transporter domain-containing protein n=1 Tax=Colletotrichum godetiae TaxID=1209918 RepID=A0AAJ0EWQ8_9PEZI|nr:uncharacterized protein BDP55DRAFT_653929 [Colletotrichum godetiae]KAK1689035.1 hypothetical protein BDP55DRAFT_653929 [Colletotrichum godetiae]
MTSSNTLPPEFEQSYREFNSFPLNHIEAKSYGQGVLQDYRKRLSSGGEFRFIEDLHRIKVPIRDVSAEGVVTKVNILGDNYLKELLGHSQQASTPLPINGTRTPQSQDTISAQKDTKCRFVFFITESSVAPLELSGTMLMRLLTFYQVMPHFADFICLYGSPNSESANLRFSGFRSKKVLKNPTPAMCIPVMDRSGRLFQLSYNLKAARLGEVNKTWKFEQYAIYHHFDVGSGVQL